MRIDSVNYNDPTYNWTYFTNQHVRPLYLVMGMGASGKDTFVDLACEKYGMTKVKSYTTRPRRSEDENTHYFVSETEFWSKDLIAHLSMGGYDYGATVEQLMEADFYIVDPFTAFTLPKRFKRPCKTILLEDSLSTRLMRMSCRGDSEEDIGKRIQEDVKIFGEEGSEFRRLIRGATDYYLRSVSRYVMGEAMNKSTPFSNYLEVWDDKEDLIV